VPDAVKLAQAGGHGRRRHHAGELRAQRFEFGRQIYVRVQHGVSDEPGPGEEIVGRELTVLPAELALIGRDQLPDHAGDCLDQLRGKDAAEEPIALEPVLSARVALE
jgi:hypothetical protein